MYRTSAVSLPEEDIAKKINNTVLVTGSLKVESPIDTSNVKRMQLDGVVILPQPEESSYPIPIPEKPDFTAYDRMRKEIKSFDWTGAFINKEKRGDNE